MPPGEQPQLVLRDLEDRHGDGDVWSFAAELAALGLTAISDVTILRGHGLSEFFAGLVEDWRGWQGERLWESLERELQLAAVHEGRRVRLRVRLRGGRRFASDQTVNEWSASATLRVEPGEELRRMAGRVAGFLTATDLGGSGDAAAGRHLPDV
jgi:hypothetical protein